MVKIRPFTILGVRRSSKVKNHCIRKRRSTFSVVILEALMRTLRYIFHLPRFSEDKFGMRYLFGRHL